MSEWINKGWSMHVMGYHSATNRNEVLMSLQPAQTLEA